MKNASVAAMTPEGVPTAEVFTANVIGARSV